MYLCWAVLTYFNLLCAYRSKAYSPTYIDKLVKLNNSAFHLTGQNAIGTEVFFCQCSSYTKYGNLGKLDVFDIQISNDVSWEKNFA